MILKPCLVTKNNLHLISYICVHKKFKHKENENQIFNWCAYGFFFNVFL